MKAKEYYEFFKRKESEVGLENAAIEVFKKMYDEAVFLMRSRKCQRKSAIAAVLVEMNGRWNAMRKFDNRLNLNGFMRLVFKYYPEVKDVVSAYIRMDFDK